MAERIITALAGGAAIAIAVRRRTAGSLVVAGLGAVAIARAVTGRCPAYRARAIRKGVQVRRSITIQAAPQQIYGLWRDLTNLPRFMHHVKAVTLGPDGTSQWIVTEGPKELAWRSKIVEDTPNKRLRWKSLPGGDLEHEGSLVLREAPGDRGTIVEIKMRYFPPGGLFVASALYGFLRKLTAIQIGQELARLQQLLETGEISTGARRLGDLDEDDKTLGAASTEPAQPPPSQAAQTSDWSVR